jgi:hypothetical protein
MTISPRWIREQGECLQGYLVDTRRANELAREIERLNRAVREAARGLAFEDEPSRFFAVLDAEAARARRGGGR